MRRRGCRRGTGWVVWVSVCVALFFSSFSLPFPSLPFSSLFFFFSSLFFSSFLFPFVFPFCRPSFLSFLFLLLIGGERYGWRDGRTYPVDVEMVGQILLGGGRSM